MSSSTTADTLGNDNFIFSFNQQKYYFQAALVSLDGAAQYLKPTAIKSFVIEDNFKDTFHKGYIIVDNMTDFIERSNPPSVANDPSNPNYYSPAKQTTPVDNTSFLLKGEARDILHIDIMPILQQDQTGTNTNNIPLQNAFRLIFDFAIYNMEEIPGDKPSHKDKKFYFHDLYYQLLTEKNVPFSTSNYLTNNSGISNLDNTERAIPTGIAIQALLSEAFPRTSQYPLDIYYDNGKGVTKTTAPITTQTANKYDPTNTAWDIGGSSIFYSTPSKYKVIDSLNYLLARHVSNADSNYDQCFLRLERSPRAMSFKSLKQYFDDALNGKNTGEIYLETVRIGNYDNSDAQDFVKNSPFTPVDGLYFSNIGTIKSYTFDNMAGIYAQSELVSNFVHSYTYGSKQFNIDIERNSVIQSMNTYYKNYVDNMLAGGDDQSANPYPNFAPGTIRSTNMNINNVFSTVENDANTRLAYGRNKFLYASTLTNNLISFRLKGSTHRQAGRFIGIDRDGAMTDSQFDDKILGVYFIVEVRHIFSGGEYYNDLHCIKTYNTLPIPNTDSTYLFSKNI